MIWNVLEEHEQIIKNQGVGISTKELSRKFLIIYTGLKGQ